MELPLEGVELFIYSLPISRIVKVHFEVCGSMCYHLMRAPKQINKNRLPGAHV